MAHMIMKNDSLFLAEKPAWHGLGTVVADALSSQEALHVAGLDWSVDSKPIVVDGKEVDGYKANVASNTGTVLGVVSDKYKPCQNTDAFSFTDSLLEQGIKYESAGSLFNQKKIWLLARMPERMILGDKIDNYLFFTNGHDGKHPITVGLTSVRVVCSNTLQMALNGAKRVWTTKHMGDLDAKKHEAARTLELAVSYLDAMAMTAEEWQQKKFTKEAFNTFVEELFPLDGEESDLQEKRIFQFRSNFIDLHNEKPDIENFRGTAWGAYLALTDYVSHVEPTRKTKTFEENRWASFMDGNKMMESGQRIIERLPFVLFG